MADYNLSSGGTVNISDYSPQAGDRFGVYNGTTLVVDEDASCLFIRLGELATGGAAPSNQRWGICSISEGVTLTFDGGANWYDSGFDMSPGSADTSSKDNRLYINGTETNPVTITNSVGYYDTNYEWAVALYYGAVDGEWLNADYYGAYIFIGTGFTSTTTTATMQRCDHLRFNSGVNFAKAFYTLGLLDVKIQSRHSTVVFGGAVTQHYHFDGAGYDMGTDFYFDDSGTTSEGGTNAVYYKFINIGVDSTHPVYISKNLTGGDPDILPTRTVPADFTVTANGVAGSADVTWSNAASYRSGDILEVWNDAETTRYPGVLDATAGSGTIYGLPESLTTVKAAATSDLWIYSDYSDTDTVTATSDAVYPTEPNVVLGSGTYGPNGNDYTPSFDESARNTDPGEANVKDGETYKILNVDYEGTYTAGTPGTEPVIDSVAAVDSGLTVMATGTAGETIHAKVFSFATNAILATEWTTVATGGSDQIDVTGLTNDAPYIVYAFSSLVGVPSTWTVYQKVSVPSATTKLTFEKIQNTIYSFVNTYIATAHSIPVQYDNQSDEDFTHTDGALFIRAWMMWGESRRQDFGCTTNRMRKTGVLQLDIYDEYGSGTKDINETIDIITDVFRSNSTSEVFFGAPSPGVPVRDGDMWKVIVKVPFRADDLG